MSQVSLDVSGIASGQPGVPEPIATAFGAMQIGHNDTDTKLTNTTSGHNHDGTNSRALSTAILSGVGLGTSNYTVSSASPTWAEVSTDFRVTLTVPSTSSIIIAMFNCTHIVGDATSYLRVGIGYDSVNPTDCVISSGLNTSESLRKPLTISTVLTGLSAGSHTFKVFAQRATANATIMGYEGSTLAIPTAALRVIIIP